MQNFREYLINPLKNALSRKIGQQRIPVRSSLRFELNALLSFSHPLLPSVDRRFHSFCVGLPRSGTHSLAYLFSPNFRSEHEPIAGETITYLWDWAHGRYSEEKMLSILAYRDKRLQLEIESSHYLHMVIDFLVKLFPEAKFILTIREPISWLGSEVSHNHNAHKSLYWRELGEYRYGRYTHDYQAFDQALSLIPATYPVRTYLNYWMDHITSVLNACPPERLLVMDTFEIKQSLDHLASFIGVSRNELNEKRGWASQVTPKLSLYDLIAKEKVVQEVETYCGDFIRKKTPFLLKYFPSLT
jgi:hypothetical protein